MLIALGLVLLTVLAYARVPSLSFLDSYDDALYVTGNDIVQQGLTRDGVVWAFTTIHAANWHPLTWLSHMLDVTLFGLNPGAHHLMNLLIHLANVLLLFAVLVRMTDRVAPSAVVAAIWALHPLHVESVAWVSERKDVLSGLFWLLAMGAYTAYTAAHGSRRTLHYLLTALCMACGLLAKPMVVTLPCVLLLLDYWPLKRFVPGVHPPRTALRLIVEKLPLFALAAASSAATVWAQHHAGAVREMESLPLIYRMANACIAVMQYLGKTYLPMDLAAIYPHPGQNINLAIGASAGLFLLLTTLAFLALAKHLPYLLMGWLWFLGTLIPVIGIVQVGSQAMADRYTYIPHIGLFVALVWTAAAILRGRRRLMRLCTAAIVAALAAATFHQTAYWRNGESLFRHTVAVTGPNPLARLNLGSANLRAGRIPEALAEFDEAVQLDPDLAMAHYNRGVALNILWRLDEARAAFETSIALDADADAYNNLGLVLMKLEQPGPAREAFESAIAMEPDRLDALLNLGSAYARTGAAGQAEEAYHKVLSLDPQSVQARINLGNLFAQTNRIDDARRLLEEAVALDSGSHLAHYNLAVVLEHLGLHTEAQMHLDIANRLRGLASALEGR